MTLWAKPELAHDPAEWLGDAHPLVEQLGSADGLASLHEVADSLQLQPVRSMAALRRFLLAYHERILVPHELPAIRTAFNRASRGELRELLEFDRQLAQAPALREFSEASRRIGRMQLLKLRPLRDERMVQRYATAMEQNKANAWHTLVYGLTLVLYSLPLRPGLVGYGYQTTRGFIHAAARSQSFSEADCRELFEEVCAPLPGVVDSLVGGFA